jgi:putative glutamine amidotransferase
VASSGSEPGGPVIGLTTYVERAAFGVWDVDAALLQRDYLEGVVRAGGVPVLLPPVSSDHERLLSVVDGLVLVGGADIEPHRYGQRAHEKTVTRPGRDAFEFALLDRVLASGIPVLGVCRGMEVLNVALGGTLTQHLPEVTGGTEHQPAIATYGHTTVRLAPGSRAARILGGETKTRCYHHQAVDRLADGLVATGWAADGTVEAVESPGEGFVLGVQWHPEQDTEDFRLFSALVDSARERRQEGSE